MATTHQFKNGVCIRCGIFEERSVGWNCQPRSGSHQSNSSRKGISPRLGILIILLLGAIGLFLMILKNDGLPKFVTEFFSTRRAPKTPPEDLVRRQLNAEVVAYGEQLVSKGLYGPEGTPVYPVRVRQGNRTMDVYFWKDPFGDWRYEYPGHEGQKLSR